MLNKIVRDLGKQKAALQKQVDSIGAALEALVGGKPKDKRKRKMSEATKRKIAKSARARWATKKNREK